MDLPDTLSEELANVVKQETDAGTWIPYLGPDGGEGWQNTNDKDDIRYGLEDPPGEIADGYEEQAEDWGPNDEQVDRSSFNELFEREFDGNDRAMSWIELKNIIGSEVYFHELEPEQVKKAGNHLIDFYESGHTEGLTELRDTFPDDMERRDKQEAAYDFTKRKVVLSPGAFDQEKIQDRYESGWWSSNDPFHNFNHEIGHLSHHANHGVELRGWNNKQYMRDIWNERKDNEVSEGTTMHEHIKSEVSKYAGFSPLEFVAEVFAGRQAGEEYSDEIMELYEDINGPKVGQ